MSGGIGEGQDHAAHRIQRDIEQVAAVDVEFSPQPVQVGQQLAGPPLDRQARDLDVQALQVISRSLDHHDVPAQLIGHQQQGLAQAAQTSIPARSGRSASAGAVSRSGGSPSPATSCCSDVPP